MNKQFPWGCIRAMGYDKLKPERPADYHRKVGEVVYAQMTDTTGRTMYIYDPVRCVRIGWIPHDDVPTDMARGARYPGRIVARQGDVTVLLLAQDAYKEGEEMEMPP